MHMYLFGAWTYKVTQPHSAGAALAYWQGLGPSGPRSDREQHGL